MARNARYDILFEPVKIGPVTARNRFYQVPHCNGMGWRDPSALAAMRGMKAEGGWAVVNTENCSVHPSSDLSPDVLQTLWDDGDIPQLALMADEVHKHGGLAGDLGHAAEKAALELGVDLPVHRRSLEAVQLRQGGGVPARARRIMDVRIVGLALKALVLSLIHISEPTRPY